MRVLKKFDDPKVFRTTLCIICKQSDKTTRGFFDLLYA